MEDSVYCLCEPDDGCTSCFKVDQRFSNVWTFRPGLSSSSSLLCLLLTATESRPVSFCSLALSHNHTVSSTPPPLPAFCVLRMQQVRSPLLRIHSYQSCLLLSPEYVRKQLCVLRLLTEILPFQIYKKKSETEFLIQLHCFPVWLWT